MKILDFAQEEESFHKSSSLLKKTTALKVRKKK